MGIFLGGDVEVDGEDEVRPGEVQVYWKSHLKLGKKSNEENRKSFNDAVY